MKGILFTEILYNKTVRKEKTMTRRAGKSLAFVNESPDDWRLMDTSGDILDLRGLSSIDTVDFRDFVFKSKDNLITSAKPNYKVGEVLYIKEPYLHGVLNEDGDTYLVYKYDFTEEERKGYKWSNKLFMGSDKASAYIRITDVRVERLYDISDEDCIKEGVDGPKTDWRDEGFLCVPYTVFTDYTNKDQYLHSPKESFFSLFRFANKIPKSKEIPNLWVWVYSYCLCDKLGNEL